ncbi:MAG: hypothetical protein WDZ40_01870 [Candidatus Spechtbacterales bacterium]
MIGLFWTALLLLFAYASFKNAYDIYETYGRLVGRFWLYFGLGILTLYFVLSPYLARIF